VVNVSVSGSVGRRFKYGGDTLLTRNNLEKVSNSQLLGPTKPFILQSRQISSKT